MLYEATSKLENILVNAPEEIPRLEALKSHVLQIIQDNEKSIRNIKANLTKRDEIIEHMDHKIGYHNG